MLLSVIRLLQVPLLLMGRTFSGCLCLGSVTIKIMNFSAPENNTQGQIYLHAVQLKT